MFCAKTLKSPTSEDCGSENVSVRPLGKATFTWGICHKTTNENYHFLVFTLSRNAILVIFTPWWIPGGSSRILVAVMLRWSNCNAYRFRKSRINEHYQHGNLKKNHNLNGLQISMENQHYQHLNSFPEKKLPENRRIWGALTQDACEQGSSKESLVKLREASSRMAGSKNGVPSGNSIDRYWQRPICSWLRLKMQIFPSYVNFIRGYPPLHGYSNGENGGKKKRFLDSYLGITRYKWQ